MQKFKTLVDILQIMMVEHRNSQAFNYKDKGVWKHLSTETFLENVRRLSLGLIKLGIEEKENVALLARSSPFWLLFDFAIMSCRAVSVPIFPFISQGHFEHLIGDAKTRIICVVGDEQWENLKPLAGNFEIIIGFNLTRPDKRVLSLQKVMEMGDRLSEEHPTLYMDRIKRIEETDLATIIYTSGSTGNPKGVELTHKNIVSQSYGADKRFPADKERDRMLNTLPLAHIFARTIMYHTLRRGIKVYFVDNVKNFAQICQEVQPTQTAVVPRILEKIYSKVRENIEHSSFLKKKLAKWAFKLAHGKKKTGWIASIKYALADLILYRKLRAAIGGKFELIISGGAPLEAGLNEFLLNIGIPVFQGYGLTETSPVIGSNYPGFNKVGTVGPLYPEVEVVIGEDEEVCVKGPNVMRGYHNLPEVTKAAFTSDGYFKTGDKGKLDEDGFLAITGRLKEIMKTSGGKQVRPIPIEQAICQHPLIDMALIIADEKPFVSVLLCPDFDALKKMNLNQASMEKYLKSESFIEEIDKFIEEVNEKLDKWEKVKKFRFIPNPLSIEAGELTPTLKIRRKATLNNYQELVDSMYEEMEQKV